MIWLSQRSAIFALCFFCAVIYLPAADAIIHLHKWLLNYEYKSPDCVEKLVITINGQSPGPTIRAQQGDTIIVEVTNNLFTEGVSIHWHGIRQRGTPWFDGTVGLTQCPILPGSTFKYEFVLDRAGTYLYHSHYGMQRGAGLYGSILVSLPDGELEPFTYDYDQSILLNDWYHKSTYEQAVGLSSIPFGWVGEPQSLLINGKGRFNCSQFTAPSVDIGICNATNPECSPYSLTVFPGKTYRLRISSLTALSSLSFQIEGHNMTVVEADGSYVEPFVVQNLFIYAGETYSVLVKTDQDPSKNYWITTNVVAQSPATPPILAILNYYPNNPTKSPQTVPPSGPAWNDVARRKAQSKAIRARHVQSNKNATSSNRIYRLRFNSTVDVILQNANTMTANNSETHPWHLHGHNFWVLGYGDGKFDKSKDPKGYNLVDPILKNTVPLHPYGWTALRFQADNPGVWFFHCHVDAHLFMGMGVVFEEGIEYVKKLPSSIMGCGGK
ncbi:hypothetical protein SLA2020_179080 [Shorea laevis]